MKYMFREKEKNHTLSQVSLITVNLVEQGQLLRSCKISDSRKCSQFIALAALVRTPLFTEVESQNTAYNLHLNVLREIQKLNPLATKEIADLLSIGAEELRKLAINEEKLHHKKKGTAFAHSYSNLLKDLMKGFAESQLSKNQYSKTNVSMPSKYKHPHEEIKVKNPEAYKDLRSMYKNLSDHEFLNVEAKIIVNESCRTVKAKYEYIRVDLGMYNRKHVCRTTITKPEYDIAFIEYRTTPEQYYDEPEDRTKHAEHKWFIKFNTEAAISKYKKCMDIMFLTYYYHPEGSSPTLLCTSYYESIDDVLEKLAKAGACPELAVSQMKHQLQPAEQTSFTHTPGFKK
jgi:hypothetical protein